MDNQFIKLQVHGVIKFISVTNKKTLERFQKDFDPKADKDNNGKLKLYTSEDILKIKGKTVNTIDAVELANEIFR